MFTGRNGRQPIALTLSHIKPKVYQAFAGLAVLLDIYARNTSLNRIHDLRMQGVRELTMFTKQAFHKDGIICKITLKLLLRIVDI